MAVIKIGMLNVYTDGACVNNPGPGGWGVLVNWPDGIKIYSGIEKEADNNRMELFALVKAVEITKQDCVIYSDSSYCVLSIEGGFPAYWEAHGWRNQRGKPISNRDLWERFMQLMREAERNQNTISIKKVKAHGNDLFNAEVDRIARERAEQAIQEFNME